MAATPVAVTVRMYQIAFGDCFLLSVRYGTDDERHVLIDFGQKGGVRRTAERPPLGSRAMLAIAEDIARRVGDAGLAGIVVSHRHEDHMSGFGVPAATDIIEALGPKVVIRSWTEDPNAPRDAGRPVADSRRFLAGLDGASRLAEALATRPFPAERTVAGREIVRTATNNISNLKAYEALERMGAAGTSEYLSAPSADATVRTALADLLPGVDIEILGPPRPEVWPAIRRQRENDPEYWLSLAGGLPGAIGLATEARAAAEAREAGDPPEADDDVGAGPDDDGAADQERLAELVDAGPSRWLVDRLRGQQLRSILRIVRWLDGSLNNTSVILLFRIGERRLLFPGDAQIENWLYALTGHPNVARIGEDLDRLDLYKVGHHGSRNATPRRLYDRWAKRAGDGRVLALMSTLRDVYGESDGTMVPSARLVEALRRQPMTLLSTEDLAHGRLSIDVTARADGTAGFEEVVPGA